MTADLPIIHLPSGHAMRVHRMGIARGTNPKSQPIISWHPFDLGVAAATPIFTLGIICENENTG